MIEGIRREYDEFIEITKLENDSYRKLQQEEYDKLRDEFENHKREQFEEKKKLMTEYQVCRYYLTAHYRHRSHLASEGPLILNAINV